MKFLKWLGFILLALFLLFVLINVISPAKLSVERSTNIKAPTNIIYNIVNDLKSGEKWSPWVTQDTAMILKYTDKTIGIGARSDWKSESMGNGYQEIIESNKGSDIKMKMEFEDFDGVSYANWKFEADGDETKVSWAMDGAENSFFTKFFNLIMKGTIKKNYDQGLANLKKMAEDRVQNKTYDGFKIQEIQLPEQYFLAQRQEIKVAAIQQFYARTLPSLGQKAAKAGLEMAGMPHGLFYKWDPSADMTDMAGAMPIAEGANVPDASTITLPERKGIQVDYYGPYENTKLAHEAIQSYLKDYNLLYDWPVMEEYVTDPGSEPNAEKWLTKVTYRLPE